MTDLVRLNCKETVWLTPPEIMTRIHSLFPGGFLDPATEPNNPTSAKVFFTEGGLDKDWATGLPVFVNPPYGKDLKFWCAKIRRTSEQSGAPIAALLPCGARFSTKYWQEEILSRYLSHICFLNKRVKFMRPDGTLGKSNPYDSAIYFYNGLDCYPGPHGILRTLGKTVVVATYSL